MKANSTKSKAAKGVPSTVKPVVVKHVLTQNYLQQPEIYENRPQKQLSEVSGLNVRQQPSMSTQLRSMPGGAMYGRGGAGALGGPDQARRAPQTNP